jgi:hypothetical protein
MRDAERTARVPVVRTTVSRSRPRAGSELALLASLYVAYSASRLLADPGLGQATGNARDVLHLEALLHLDVEGWLNSGLNALPVLALVASYWYSLLHYVVTPAVLVWVYRTHPDRYRFARNSLVLGSALGIAGFALLPTAPPRMLPGYVDTLASTASSGWWGSDASAPRGLGELTNQLAAMPSLHVGWAVWCAAVVLLCTRRRWVQVLAVAYPVLTTVVVVATANHYLLDAVAGVLVLAAGTGLAARLPVRATEAAPHDGQRSSSLMLPSLAFCRPSRADHELSELREQAGQSTTNTVTSGRDGPGPLVGAGAVSDGAAGRTPTESPTS